MLDPKEICYILISKKCAKKTAKYFFSKKNKAEMLVNILLKRFAFTLKASSVT